MFERFPGHFEQESLLRVHRFCFTRTDAKELWVELVDVFDEASPGGPFPLARVPARSGSGTNGVAARAHQLPERFRVAGSWKPATHADDRHLVGDGQVGVG